MEKMEEGGERGGGRDCGRFMREPRNRYKTAGYGGGGWWLVSAGVEATGGGRQSLLRVSDRSTTHHHVDNNYSPIHLAGTVISQRYSITWTIITDRYPISPSMKEVIQACHEMFFTDVLHTGRSWHATPCSTRLEVETLLKSAL